MGQKVISLTEARRLFPRLRPQWQANHPDCKEPESVALGHPDFGTVRHVVVVETDEQGKPIRPLYDKMQVEEGPAKNRFPGSIIVPWYLCKGVKSIVLCRTSRPVLGDTCLEFPQGYAQNRAESPIEAGKRIIQTKFSLTATGWVELPSVCPEPDWYSRGTAVVTAKLPIRRHVDLPRGLERFPINELQWTNQVVPATSLGALMRFLAWIHSA